MQSVDFDVYKDKDDTKQKQMKVVKKSNKQDAFEIIISEQQCTEIACFTMTYQQCEMCRNFKCEKHLNQICGKIFGPYCIYCYKRKWYIIIGTAICVVIIIALLFYILHNLGVYS